MFTPTQIDDDRTRELGHLIKDEIPGLAFCLLIFEFNKPGIANYISNAERADMIKAMKETIERLEAKQDFKTPNKKDN